MPYKDLEQRRECGRLAQQKHYAKNKEYYRKKNREGKLKIKKFINDYKKDKSCKCGESDSRCLDFHHRDPKIKKFNIANAVNLTKNIAVVIKEIKKCDLTCANCHRKITLK